MSRYRLKTKFLNRFLTPKISVFGGQSQITPIVIQQSLNEIRMCDIRQMSMSRCLASSQIPIFGPNLGPKSSKYGLKNFFNNWYYLNLLDIIVVYHNMQYKKILMSSSRKNEFGDKNNLETSLNWAQIWP